MKIHCFEYHLTNINFFIDSAISLYVIVTSLENGGNAEYRLGTSGHGDIIAPLAGDDVWAISFGLTYKMTKQFKLP